MQSDEENASEILGQWWNHKYSNKISKKGMLIKTPSLSYFKKII